MRKAFFHFFDSKLKYAPSLSTILSHRIIPQLYVFKARVYQVYKVSKSSFDFTLKIWSKFWEE